MQRELSKIDLKFDVNQFFLYEKIMFPKKSFQSLCWVKIVEPSVDYKDVFLWWKWHEKVD